MTINAFLGVICGLYAVFLLSQIAYFSNAFAGILPQTYTVAEYARRGFFEMCIIGAINLLLVATALFLSRKEAGKAPRSTRLMCLFVLLFSIGMVAVALAKMYLYVGSFGMTRLRVLTSVFMLMLGLVLLFVCIQLFAVRFPYMRACVISVALLGLTIAYADVDTVIARYNVRAYQSGALEEVDVSTLAKLSDGALPYLLELCDDQDPEVARQAASFCHAKLEASNELWLLPWEKTDLRSYNVDSRRAAVLLAENADKIQKLLDNYRHDSDPTDGSWNMTFTDDSATHLSAYLGEYYNTQQIDELGVVAIKGSVETATVFHAYYPDSFSDTSVILGEQRIGTTRLSKPSALGIYIVAGDEVVTLEDAYYRDLVYMEDVCALLPTIMWMEDVTW